MTVKLDEDTLYVVYRGTDDTIVGWREDFNMSFMPCVPAQLEASDYLSQTMKGRSENLYIGGHSKGGNIMKLSDRAYDICKLIGTIVLPALAVFYTSLAGIWGLPFVEEVPKTIMAVDLLFNTCLGFSTANYYKELAKADEVLLPEVEKEM